LTRGKRWLAVTAASATLLVAGCGDDEPETPSGAGNGSERVVIEAREGAFNAHQAFRAAAPGVVTILSVFDRGELAGSGGQGSGFVLNEEGEIATNAHVVTDGAAGGGGPINEADEVYVEFADRNRVEAEIVGYDPHADVALIKVDPDGLDLSPVSLGSIAEDEVGEPVVALGGDRLGP
jgi:putative serine protease PepD